MTQQLDDRQLLEKVLEIYDQKQIAEHLNGFGQAIWNRESINR